jgi:hypothetical protein
VLHRRLAASPSHRGITGASGRLTAGLALWQALCHRRTIVQQSRAGGVSPPWIRYRDCTGVCEHTAGSLPDFPEALLQLRLPSHGGLTPAAPDSDARHARGIRFPVPERLSHHGGLTPAALGNVRSCIAQIVFLTGRRPHTNTRAGGVSPPWQATNRQKTSVSMQPHPHIRIKSGWRKPAVARVSVMCGKRNHPAIHGRRCKRGSQTTAG